MAWNFAFSRKERKEAAKHKRSAETKKAIEEPQRNGKKAFKGKKLFAIEYRWFESVWNERIKLLNSRLLKFRGNNDWKVWKKYATAKQRDTAMEAMSKLNDKNFEYRSVDFN